MSDAPDDTTEPTFEETEAYLKTQAEHERQIGEIHEKLLFGLNTHCLMKHGAITENSPTCAGSMTGATCDHHDRI